jgi:type IV pilus assembly protein PilB
MNEEDQPLILSIDDDIDIRMLIEVYLSNANYEVISSSSPTEALTIVEGRKPDLILLDVIMPEMNGYEFCSRLQDSNETNTIPVIFLTSLWEEADKARAFAVGAADFLNKPIQKNLLLEQVADAIEKGKKWKKMSEGDIPFHLGLSPTYLDDFIKFLQNQLVLTDNDISQLENITHNNIYHIANEIGITNEHLAQYIGGFLKLPYMKIINPESLKMGILATSFCRSKKVIPISTDKSKLCFVISNPFDWDLLDWISQVVTETDYDIVITEPKNITSLLGEDKKDIDNNSSLDYITHEDLETLNSDSDDIDITNVSDKDMSPIIYIADKLIRKAVTDNASDIHIEPKKDNTVVRFRINGDMVDILKLKKRTGTMLLCRLKAIGHLDIAEQKKPQDGSVETKIGNDNIKMRLATTSTPDGESLIMRVLQTQAEVKSFASLGMTKKQAEDITTLANHTQGLILVVGPTGSGKTTTIYSLLSLIDCQTRSLLSIEDPVEYRIPYANQQQVNIKRGVTFESLLKSVVRQDPDIMFLGEVRDTFSANISLDFASTGHLTITSLHTNNSVTAVFRLERLGVSRSAMADSIIGIIAQRLVKKPCPYCKKLEAPTPEEVDILKMFTSDIPEKVAHPNGCLKCNQTGYGGREGVYEVLPIDLDIAQQIRSGVEIPEIRRFLLKRGDYLICTQALEKIRNHTFTVDDAFERVLIEDMDYYLEGKATNYDIAEEIPDEEIAVSDNSLSDENINISNDLLCPENIPESDSPEMDKPLMALPNANSHEPIPDISSTQGEMPTLIGVSSKQQKDLENAEKVATAPKKILIVDDDEDVRILLNHFLVQAGYETILAVDGVDALMTLGRYKFDIILSDVDMPNLDGFKLMEMLNSKDLKTPVVFLTANDDAKHELEGLKLGAADYLKKPLEKDILLLKISRLLGD